MFPLKAMSSVPDFFSSLHLAGITTLVGLQCAPGVEPLGTEGRPQSPGAPDSSPSRGRGVGCCGPLGVLWLDAGPVASEATLSLSPSSPCLCSAHPLSYCQNVDSRWLEALPVCGNM